MVQESQLSDEGKVPKEELDHCEEIAIMQFVRDYPRISEADRRRLLKGYKNLSTRKESLIESKEIVEAILKKEFESILPPWNDWSYSFKFAPYDMETREQLQIPGVMASASSKAGETTKWVMFFPNEIAWGRFATEIPQNHFPPVIHGKGRLP